VAAFNSSAINSPLTVRVVELLALDVVEAFAVKVLAPPGTTYKDVVQNLDKIEQIRQYSENNGRSFDKILPPLSVSSKRIGIKYAEDGGAEADGVIYVRPGVHDVSLGKVRYAQVRIAVDGTHYLKGMAMYKDDLPAGKDLVFNTNKSNKFTIIHKFIMEQRRKSPAQRRAHIQQRTVGRAILITFVFVIRRARVISSFSFLSFVGLFSCFFLGGGSARGASVPEAARSGSSG
jgi:hypothetical protein